MTSEAICQNLLSSALRLDVDSKTENLQKVSSMHSEQNV